MAVRKYVNSKEKERAVPAKEIDLAVKRKERFTTDPEKHTFEE